MSKGEKSSEGKPSRSPAISIGVPSPPVYAGEVQLSGGIDPGWNGVDQAPYAVDSVTVDSGGVAFTSHNWHGTVGLGVGKNVVVAVVDAEGHKGRAQVEIDALQPPTPPTIGIEAPTQPLQPGRLQLRGTGSAGFDPATNSPWAIHAITVQVDQASAVSAQWSGQTNFTWNAEVDLQPGAHTITATLATNGPTATAVIHVTVTVPSTPPTIGIDPPSMPLDPGLLQIQGSGSLGLNGATNAPWNIQSVTIQIDQGNLEQAQWSVLGGGFRWGAEPVLTPGPHTITATVHTDGPTASAAIHVDVLPQSTPPTIAIEQPAPPVHAGPLQLRGTGTAGLDAATNSPWTIQRISLQVDQGVTVAAQWSGQTEFTWNGEVDLQPGGHTITATVWTNGPLISASIYIEIAAATGVPVTGWEIVSTTYVFGPGESKPIKVAAPPGKYVLGGGYFPVSDAGGLNVLGSWPSDANTWTVYANNPLADKTTPPPSLTAYAICGEIAGLQIVTQTAAFAPGESKVVLVACPPGTRVVGGGWFSKDEQGALILEGSWASDANGSRASSDGSTWAVFARNPGQKPATVPPTVIAYAVCAEAAEGWQALTTQGQFTGTKMETLLLTLPSGKRLLSGGFVPQQGQLAIQANAPLPLGSGPPDGTQWTVYATDLASTTSVLIANAICAQVS